MDRDRTESQNGLTVDEVADIVVQSAIYIMLVIAVLSTDCEKERPIKPQHKPKGKWRFK